ncbi:MAG: efflux RND transporter periplasmic adaptor subunit [Nitrospinales bacterium]
MRLFLALLLILYQGSPLSAQPSSGQGVPVGVAKTVLLSAKSKIDLSGTVLPWATSRLAAETDGRVERLYFNEGQYVKKGALLVQLDTRPLELERALAVAEKKQAATRLEELQAGSRSETIDAATAAVAQTEARLKMTQIELNRTEKLYREGVLSVHDYDNKRALHDETLAQFAEKKARLEEAVAGPRIERIRQAEAALLAAERRIRIIEDRIERSLILAPFDGSIATKDTEVGQWLEKGDPALTLIAINPLKVEVHVPQQHFNKIELGATARIILEFSQPNSPGTAFQGTVIEKIYSGDVTSRTFPVRVKVHPTQAKLAPGMLVRVEFSPQGKTAGNLYAPKDAIVRTPRETAVWVAREDKDKSMRAFKVPVKTGQQTNGLIAIQPIGKQIAPGEWVVVQGNERLRPNTKIEIQKRY